MRLRHFVSLLVTALSLFACSGDGRPGENDQDSALGAGSTASESHDSSFSAIDQGSATQPDVSSSLLPTVEAGIDAHGAMAADAIGCRTDAATPPLTKGQRIFGSGHSYHYGFVDLLTEVAKSAGFADHKTIGESEIGGSFVYQHWAVPGVQQALHSGTVDLLTTTPIYLPDTGIEDFAKLGVEQNFRVTMMEFWLPYDEYQPCYYEGPPGCPTGQKSPPGNVDHNAQTGDSLRKMHEPYFREMDALVVGINQKLGRQAIAVVPVGQAVIALREKVIAGQAPTLKSQADLFVDALGHPGSAIKVMDVYSHFAVIYRRSPVGLPVPKLLSSASPSPDVTALNTLLQELAWSAVLQHPLSGVGGGVSCTSD